MHSNASVSDPFIDPLSRGDLCQLFVLRIGERSLDHAGRLSAPLGIFPVEFESIAVWIEKIDASVSAGGVLLQPIDLGTLFDQAAVQLLERGQATVGFEGDVIEALRLSIGIGRSACFKESDIAEPIAE